MRITEHRLRRLIRSLLREQVVGYKAPSKSYDDPMGNDSESLSGTSGSTSGSSGDDSDSTDGSGYESVGDMGVDLTLDDSPESQKASAMQVKKLTQQRQQALDKGDSVGADSAGEQLSMARKIRG